MEGKVSMSVLDKRLQKELGIILRDKIEGIVITPNENNLREWTAYIEGPKDTPYFQGVFKLTIQFTEKYPFEPPKVKFDTPTIHPNINSKGKICMSTFRNDWSPGMTIQKVLLSIQSLLSSPNPDDPLVPEIANMYKNNYTGYVELVKKYTKKYAMTQ